MKFMKKKEQDYSLFTAAANAGITAQQMQALFTAQQGEYDAAEKYKHIINDFPEVVEVMNDEVHHGDAVLGLL